MSSAGLMFALLVARGAEAQSKRRYAVEWSTAEGAETCLQDAELTAAVGKLVSADLLTSAEQADRVIFGTARRDESWHATLTVVDVAGKALGERELASDADSCRELSASIALAIALMIDPEHLPRTATAETEVERSTAVLQSSEPRGAEPEVPKAPVPGASFAPISRVNEVPSKVIEAKVPPRRAVKGSAVVLSGVLPEVAIGAQGEFWQPLASVHSLRVALAYFGEQTLGVPGRAGASAKLYLVTVRAAFCPLLAAARKLSVFGCAGLESGLMIAHGQGGGYDNTAVRALLALDGALTVDWGLAGPWAVSLTAGAAVAPFRPRFSYRAAAESIEVQRRGVLEGRLEIGPAYRF